MVRALVLATLAVVISQAAASQTLGVLHIKVVLLDATGSRRRCRIMRCS